MPNTARVYDGERPILIRKLLGEASAVLMENEGMNHESEQWSAHLHVVESHIQAAQRLLADAKQTAAGSFRPYRTKMDSGLNKTSELIDGDWTDYTAACKRPSHWDELESIESNVIVPPPKPTKGKSQ